MQLDVKKLSHAALSMWHKNSPTILGGLSIGGYLASVGLGINATIKAVKRVEEAEKEKGEKLTKKEIFKEVWPFYVSTLCALTAATASGFGSLHKWNEKSTSYAAGYALYEAAHSDLEEQVEKYVSKKKIQETKDEEAEKKVDSLVWDERTVRDTGVGQPILDLLTGQQFIADIEMVKRGFNNANAELLNNRYYISVNEALSYIPGMIDDTVIGDLMVFTLDRGLIDPDFSSTVKIKSGPYAGRSAIVIRHNTEPVPLADVY